MRPLTGVHTIQKYNHADGGDCGFGVCREMREMRYGWMRAAFETGRSGWRRKSSTAGPVTTHTPGAGLEAVRGVPGRGGTGGTSGMTIIMALASSNVVRLKDRRSLIGYGSEPATGLLLLEEAVHEEVVDDTDACRTRP